MTPKEKAKDLIDKHFGFEFNGYGEPEVHFDLYKIKKQALISIEFAREFITGDLNESFDKNMYLFEVKKEIEKL